jgi:uncharacterized repeat protein (TIGR03803 family)
MRYFRVLWFHVFSVLVLLISCGVQAQTFSVLYNLGSAADDPIQPGRPGMVAQGRDGNLYSTAPHGGTCCGTVFQVTPAGKLTNIHSFSSNGDDGGFPQGGVILGTDGNFYGTTYEGGTSASGVVFKVTSGGTYMTLYSFTGGSDGGFPYAPPIEGNDGNFYGTTPFGGDVNTCNGGCGTIYKITPAGNLTTLYQFDITHGNGPYAPLVLGTDGNFYGTTEYGGADNVGVVFKITPAGKFTVVYAFDETRGEFPLASLAQGSDGNFYGTTEYGGTQGSGVVFKLTPAGKITVLHSLNGTSDGSEPYGGLVQASDGNLYGTSAFGGTMTCDGGNGCGTLFKVSLKGAFSVLYKFNGTAGEVPSITPFQHTTGPVYGDTQRGGTGDVSPCTAGQCGVFYSWNNSVLRAFVSLLNYSGKVGKMIEFLGQGFVKGKTTVSFNGTAATPTVVSGTYLTAAVPSGATTGLVTVTTSGVKLASDRVFRVTPQITNFNPTSGSIGTAVKIVGVSLTQTEKITFGGVVATDFTVNSDKQVTAIVPTGAVTGHITITTAGGTAVSSDVFTVTQ